MSVDFNMRKHPRDVWSTDPLTAAWQSSKKARLDDPARPVYPASNGFTVPLPTDFYAAQNPGRNAIGQQMNRTTVACPQLSAVAFPQPLTDYQVKTIDYKHAPPSLVAMPLFNYGKHLDIESEIRKDIERLINNDVKMDAERFADPDDNKKTQTNDPNKIQVKELGLQQKTQTQREASVLKRNHRPAQTVDMKLNNNETVLVNIIETKTQPLRREENGPPTSPAIPRNSRAMFESISASATNILNRSIRKVRFLSERQHQNPSAPLFQQKWVDCVDYSACKVQRLPQMVPGNNNNNTSPAMDVRLVNPQQQMVRKAARADQNPYTRPANVGLRAKATTHQAGQANDTRHNPSSHKYCRKF